MRRAGRIGEFVSVYLNKMQKAVYLASDGGRVCRPLLVIENGCPKITQEHIAKLGDSPEWSLENMLRKGIIEYIDVNEENDCLIALKESNLTPG